MITLNDINEDNWREELAVAPDQREYVSDGVGILARAYAYRDKNSYACVICDDDEPVGMALYYDCPELNAYDFSQMFIDARYQRRGYGKTAAKMLLDRMRREHRFDSVVLCYIEGNDAARTMYEGLGFYHTGEADEDEIIMKLDF